MLVQQSLAASTDANKSVAVIQSGFQQNLRDQEAKVVTPVVGLGTRMDQMSQDLHPCSRRSTDLTQSHVQASGPVDGSRQRRQGDVGPGASASGRDAGGSGDIGRLPARPPGGPGRRSPDHLRQRSL